MKNNEFCIGKVKYSVQEIGQHLDICKSSEDYYSGKAFGISKDNEDWSTVNIEIAGKVEAGWEITTKKQVDLNEFLSQISPYIVKIGICNNRIHKIENGRTTVSYRFMHNLNHENPCFIPKKVCSTPEETIEYYKKEAEEILVRKEKTC